MEKTAQQIHAYLKRHGVPMLDKAPTEPEMEMDGSVDITEKIHVQVGWHYVNVVVENEDGTFTFHDPSPTLPALLAKLRTLMPIKLKWREPSYNQKGQFAECVTTDGRLAIHPKKDSLGRIRLYVVHALVKKGNRSVAVNVADWNTLEGAQSRAQIVADMDFAGTEAEGYFTKS